ncbi:MAG: YceH family protein [Steroidobacteraceae bacterium]
MSIKLSPIEARIIGCLIEKSITTPDQYPLSLNALTNACNQKSNRAPALDLDEHTVQQALGVLIHKHLILDRSGFGSRVPKYQHRLCNTGFGSLEFTAVETAILCELLIRGPQTPSELRTRAARMADIKEISEVETALNNLATKTEGPFVVRLPRQANRRDACYAHLLCGEVVAAESEPDISTTTTSELRASSSLARIEQLQLQVADLQRELAALKHKHANS